MDHYLDFRLLPDPEFPAPVLMNALFSKLHRALVRIDNRAIGVSFPDVRSEKPSLGGCLRLHGTEEKLSALMNENWLTGMRDHIEQAEIAPVPGDMRHRRIRRVQPKSNAERLRRRYAKRHPDVSPEEIAKLIPESVEQRVKLPFLQLKSQSSGHAFRLFLEHAPLRDEPTEGEFNTYGLSARATVPWF